VTVGNVLDLVNAPDVTSISALIADDGGDGISLREAITAANNTAGADTITFDSNVFTGGSASLIRLGGTALDVTDSLTIEGLTGTDVVITADADGDDVTVGTTDITDVVNNTNTSDNSRVFFIGFGAGDTTLRGLTITGGVTGFDSNGGGISSTSPGILTLDQSTVSGNATISSGGGISTYTGTTTITSSTISGNSAGYSGGGIFASNGTTTIISSTISGNSTDRDGGGIYVSGGTTTIISSTISGNYASNDVRSYGYGGGIFARRQRSPPARSVEIRPTKKAAEFSLPMTR